MPAICCGGPGNRDGGYIVPLASGGCGEGVMAGLGPGGRSAMLGLD